MTTKFFRNNARNPPVNVDHPPQEQPLQNIPDERSPNSKTLDKLEDEMPGLLSSAYDLRDKLNG